MLQSEENDQVATQHDENSILWEVPDAAPPPVDGDAAFSESGASQLAAHVCQSYWELVFPTSACIIIYGVRKNVTWAQWGRGNREPLKNRTKTASAQQVTHTIVDVVLHNHQIHLLFFQLFTRWCKN